jgi:hypothetical protein
MLKSLDSDHVGGSIGSSDDAENGDGDGDSASSVAVSVEDPNAPLPEAQEISLDRLRAVLDKPRILQPGQYEIFTELKQKRISIMSIIAQSALVHHQTNMIENTVAFVLSFVWDPADVHMRDLLVSQTDLCFVLAESLVTRLSTLWIHQDMEE